MKFFYPSSLIRKSVGKTRSNLAVKFLDEFRADISPDVIELRQTELLNEAWGKAQLLPFYAEWKRINNLPEKISSISELKEWPILTKGDLQNGIDLVTQTPGVIGAYRTSGSTGEPFNFPKGAGEFSDLYGTMWSFRAANGLRPFDPSLVVSTTVTNAARSRRSQLMTRWVRATQDIVSNSWHIDGFIATSKSADKALKALKFSQAKYIIGFPSGIVNMARRAEELNITIPSLTHAILTSETVDPADVRIIERVFGVRVLVEYGATELGVIAGTKEEAHAWPLKVHWWNSLVLLTPSQEILVTTLSKRVFPLINYALGDIVEPSLISNNGSLLSIKDVRGRTRDTVSVNTKSGGRQLVFAREITYLVRDLDGVESVQVSQVTEGEIQLYIVAPSTEKRDLVRRMSSSLMRNHKDLLPQSITLNFIEKHISSARGKRGVVIDYPGISISGEVFTLNTN